MGWITKLAKIVVGPAAVLQLHVAKKVYGTIAEKVGIIDSEYPDYGDVIYCERKLGTYRHFGVYAGHGSVIHFAPKNGDIGGTAVVHRIPLSKFADGDTVHVMKFPSYYDGGAVWRQLKNRKDYQPQTPKETVSRAKSMLGMRGNEGKGYDLILNNCEHFAIWCKTNVAESKQVNFFMDLLL